MKLRTTINDVTALVVVVPVTTMTYLKVPKTSEGTSRTRRTSHKTKKSAPEVIYLVKLSVERDSKD